MWVSLRGQFWGVVAVAAKPPLELHKVLFINPRLVKLSVRLARKFSYQCKTKFCTKYSKGNSFMWCMESYGLSLSIRSENVSTSLIFVYSYSLARIWGDTCNVSDPIGMVFKSVPILSYGWTWCWETRLARLGPTLRHLLHNPRLMGSISTLIHHTMNR